MSDPGRPGPAFVRRRPYAEVTVGVPREVHPGERRVAITPPNVAQLVQKGYKVVVEAGAGVAADFPDAMYSAVGARVGDRAAAFGADVVLKVRPPAATDDGHEVDLLPEGAVLICLVQPAQNRELLDRFVKARVTVFALDCIPRISRSQVYDVLSSMANVAGYKAVLEAANAFGRYFKQTITAAGKVQPAKVLVIGAGVAGLSAIATAKGMGAIVRAFDVRAACKEQVESMGAEFLQVNVQETGEGAGGYAKAMSERFHAAEKELFLRQCRDVDIVITTALIPGQPAPRLLTEEHIDAMKPGSVTVDLAAENGGNIATTRPGEAYVYRGRVTCIGYTDLPSRLPTQSSTLFGNNVTKFLLAMGPTGEFGIDMNDVVFRNSLVAMDGELLWPPPPLPEQPKPAAKVEVSKEEAPVDPLWATTKRVCWTTVGMCGLAAVGVNVPETWVGNLTTFALSTLVGYQIVLSVTPSLHTPLMSVTNAVSGSVIVGGLLLTGGGAVPTTAPQVLALASVFMASINIFGGFHITGRMLDMFKKGGAAAEPEYHWLWCVPAVTWTGLYAAARLNGYPGMDTISYLTGSLFCILSIAGLSHPETSRMGNSLGKVGIYIGTMTTLVSMSSTADPWTYLQIGLAISLGGATGLCIAERVQITALPQLVAAFHSVVGLAAVVVAFAQFVAEINAFATSDIGSIQRIAIFLGAVIGGVTFTGSLVAFAKLNGNWKSDALELPARDFINVGMGLGLVVLFGAYISRPPDLHEGLIELGCATAIAFFEGWHLTDSIGGADMPVVITVLNSYSGWALVAEGFMLENEMLLIVGSLIGSSGALLTWIMCKAMNRSIVGVIFGGLGTAKGPQMAITGEATVVGLDEVVTSLVNARKVIIVPGYGLAVAQGQYPVAEMVSTLRKNGVDVTFAIHPVAGRMPGQLNVLLAEANIPYDIVFEMDEINDKFESADVSLVVGANDTINSSAEDDPNSPIAGMPVLRVWKANKCIILKRSMATGYAGVDNPVFYKSNTEMFLGDAKKNCCLLQENIQKYYSQNPQ